MARRVSTLLGLALLAACIPDLPRDQGLVTAPRVLAVRAVPAEAPPGARVELSALVAGAPADGLEWALCVARKPLTELGPVAQECIDGFAAGGRSIPI